MTILADLGPAMSRSQLGARLRELRQDRGLRLHDVAASLGVAPSTVSRIETGKAPARAPYVRSLLDVYGLDDPAQRDQLDELARNGWHSGSHAPYRDLLPAGAAHYLSLEAEAVTIRSLATQAIPLLLATPAYTAPTSSLTWPNGPLIAKSPSRSYPSSPRGLYSSPRSPSCASLTRSAPQPARSPQRTSTSSPAETPTSAR